MSESGKASPLATDAIDDSIQRDSEIWFEDGNIVVITQNTAFRFHKSVLSLHSPVFRDLFLVPQPSPAGGEEPVETLDGCPVVRVSDTSYDFRELLRAIYGGVSHLHPDKAVTFAVLAALARLSHKYQLDELLEAVVPRLKGTFTTELEMWDKSRGFYELPPLGLTSDHAIEALNLFRLLDRPEMIPVALYWCCQLRPAVLLRGVTRSDGVTREHPSPTDLELCFEVKEKLVQATIHLLLQLCEVYEVKIAQVSGNQDCQSPDDCLDGLRDLLDVFRGFLHDSIDADPLDTYYAGQLDESVESGGMCSSRHSPHILYLAMKSHPSSPALAPGEPQQDTELWFEDGNMVIVAGNAAFRVHTGILSRHSEVFQNMFSVPQPTLPAPSDVVDGQPVIHVSDSAHDFKQLLYMLYDGVKYVGPRSPPVAFGILAALARLGHKYHIDWVLKEATRRLKILFTRSYEDWTKHHERSNHLVVLSPFIFPRIEVLNLIRLVGETDMLPVAIYRCCEFPSLLVTGVTRVDGTVETLDLPTLELCVNAHTRLIQRQAQLNAEVFCGGPSKSCQQTEACRAAMVAAYREVCGRPDAFLSGSLLDFRLSFNILGICSSCEAYLVEREQDGMKAAWKDLPKLTGVEVDNWN
ncbi:hypothetical protein LXA43DRAFT_952359 [Ganoderma leucocontextum]|nr:hypothetical protein LXA43DRAFT_952359 [Ganoderma leucocontextum]